MKKLNILQLITGLPIGGAEKVLLGLCSNLEDDMIENFVVGLNSEDALNSDFEEEGIYVSNLNMTKDIKSMYKTVKTLITFVEEKEIDIVHAHMYHPLIFAYLLKLKFPKLKIVFTSHSENIGSSSREKITKLLKNFRDTDIIFSKQMHIDIYKDDAKVIPNGIDIEKFHLNENKNDIYTFIAVGVLREGKNHVALVEYAVKLKSLGYNFLIEIVGSGDDSGDESENIAKAIEKADVSDVVKMVGSSNDIPALLAKAHCFVMPSLYEGLPISLLEAGASKLPVITTPVGAIPSVIGEGYGYLSTLDEFANTMEYVLKNKEEAKRVGSNLYDLMCEKYSIANMVEQHEEIYRSNSDREYLRNIVIDDKSEKL